MLSLGGDAHPLALLAADASDGSNGVITPSSQDLHDKGDFAWPPNEAGRPGD